MSLWTYLGFLFCGLTFFAMGWLFGGHDGDFHDGGNHHGHDSHGHDGGFSIRDLLSVRSVVFFIIGFGAVGAILTSFNRSPVITSVLSVLAGIGFAFAGLFLIQLLVRLQGNSISSLLDLEGVSGLVITAIPPGGVGEIQAVNGSGDMNFVTARSFDGEGIELGADIEVVSVLNGEAVVKKVGYFPPAA